MIIVYTLTENEKHSKALQIESLLSQISEADTSALGQLYELIETDVFAYALSKTANKENAEDITQDTFIQIWKNATQYKPMGKPLAWIFTIELNLIRRQFNLNNRNVSLDEAVNVESEDGDFTQSVINNEFLRELLNVLNEEEREIISLHVVSGLKHREIAKLLDKSLSTVLSKYNRAIKKLQSKIQIKETE